MRGVRSLPDSLHLHFVFYHISCHFAFLHLLSCMLCGFNGICSVVLSHFCFLFNFLHNIFKGNLAVTVQH